MPGARIRSAALCHVVILEPIRLADEAAESLKFRIEVFRWAPDVFTCQLWRRETFKIRPSFQSGEETWDGEGYLLESGLAWEQIEGRTAAGVLEAVVRLIEDRFAVGVERPRDLNPSGT